MISNKDNFFKKLNIMSSSENIVSKQKNVPVKSMRTVVNKRKSKGLTFIEVLVSLAILVTGVLGAVALQATVKKSSFDAMQRSLASAIAQDIVERMRSNTSNQQFLENYQGVYGEVLNAIPVACNSPANICTPLQMVDNDLYEWERAIMGLDITRSLDDGSNASAGGLVNGRGCIDHNNNAITVVVSWQGRTDISDGFVSGNFDTATANFVGNCGQGNDKRRQVVIEAFIN